VPSPHAAGRLCRRVHTPRKPEVGKGHSLFDVGICASAGPRPTIKILLDGGLAPKCLMARSATFALRTRLPQSRATLKSRGHCVNAADDPPQKVPSIFAVLHKE
jgi:hypothetical protein